MTLSGWQRAVYDALCDLSGPGHPTVTRHELLQRRLPGMLAVLGRLPDAPGQAVSLALQRLRDKGLIEFVGSGMYRLREPEPERMVVATMVTPGGGETRQRIETDAEGFVVHTEREVVGPRAGELTVIEAPVAAPEPPLPTLALLRPDDLLIDDYQRAERSKWIADRKGKFSRLLYEEVRVNHRPDGTYYCFNGQQRTLLARAEGLGQTPLPAVLYEGLTRDQEIDRYIETQRPGTSSTLTALDRFWAEYHRPSQEERDIAQALEQAGVRLAKSKAEAQAGTVGVISAIQDVRAVLAEQGSGEGLTRVIGALVGPYGRRGLALTGDFLRGMSCFHLAYPAHDGRRLLGRLQSVTPERLQAWALTKAGGAAKTQKAIGFAYALRELYNHSLTVNRLPIAPLRDREVRLERRGRGGRRAWQGRQAAVVGSAGVASAPAREELA